MNQGNMRIFYSFVFFASFFFFPKQLQAQPTLTIDEQWLGNWVAQDTGIQITREYIDRLINVDGSWETASFPGKRFYFFDSPVVSKRTVLEGWIFSSYTSMRLYHKNEGRGETTIEAVEYKAIKLELIGGHTMQLSVSKTFRTKQENKRPAVQLSAVMFADLAKNGYLSTRVFKKLGSE